MLRWSDVVVFFGLARIEGAASAQCRRISSPTESVEES